MVEKEFSIDEQKIAEYFPLQSTIEGMLTIFEELFGFVFVEIDSEERTKLSGMYPWPPSLWIGDANRSILSKDSEMARLDLHLRYDEH